MTTSNLNINPHKLRNLRSRRKLSQQEVADKLGLSRSAYAKWENGQTKINVEHIKALASVLEKDIMELFSELLGTNTNIGGVVGSMGDHSTVEYADPELAIENAKLTAENKELRAELKGKDELLKSKEQTIQKCERENQTLQDLVASLQDLVASLKEQLATK
ncbi:helix-turn-helix domain-containing protein [Conchiformibius kuhniae]|uniref:Helix-turn-helix domain-containing protein n=1 Tax=Conchiformibius kuhniae TaxID=211502 RepID=A0A8T9MYX2_9NEIS|nr:helix-turn-helix transcriptional regulator [Conchiformibius kuhniae]UOP05596.1 helix-turn-helix domain-containing protein [Conchiformibius kuhniae]